MGFDFEDLVAPGLLLVVVLILGGLFYAAFQDAKEWEQFKEEHNCKKVAHISGDVFNTIGTDAKGNITIGVGTTPDKEGWACDDGVTYYR